MPSAATASARRSIPTIPFGVWTKGEGGDELVPVGKAYFGFTDEELLEIDNFVRRNTIDRFGPVREVTHDGDKGLVFEVAFEGLAALDPAQVRPRDAVSPHQPAALGQAAARGRPAGDAGADAGRSKIRVCRPRQNSSGAACVRRKSAMMLRVMVP